MRIASLRRVAMLAVALSVPVPSALRAQPLPTQPKQPPVFAISNARVVTVSGQTLDRGTVLVSDGVIRAVAFEGEGCAISQASASLMTDALKGRSVEQALELSRAFRAMIRGQPPAPELGELSALQGIAKLHARVKCATLAWTTLDEALEGPETRTAPG